MTRVLVTGGAGFVGSHLVDRLVDEGYDVIVLDNLIDQVHDGEPEYLNSNAEYVWGDVRNRNLMADLMRDADVVNHHASAVGVGQSMYEIERYVDVNSLGTARLLDVIVNEEITLQKLIVPSSMTIYGEGQYHCPACDERRCPPLRPEAQLAQGDWMLHCPECDYALEPVPTPESMQLDTSNVYAITKHNQEQLSLAVGEAYDLPVVALRYFNVYGSRQSLDNPYTGVCAVFSSRIKNGNPPVLFEDGQQTRDFIHVSDVAMANQLAIETEAANGEVINIGSGVPTTIEEIGRTLLELYGRGDALDPEVSGEYRTGDIRHSFADTSKAEELLGFETQVSFNSGMRELVGWGRERDADDRFETAHRELQEKGLTGMDGSGDS